VAVTHCTRFTGRNVLVVGGGADGPPRPGDQLAMGNGRAIALRLAAEGASVAVTDRDADSAAATVSALAGRGLAIRADAANPDDCRRAVDEAEAALGPLDVVVLNVGIASGAALHDQTLDDWQWHDEVNVRSHWLTAQHALPKMIERGHGTFVFVTSIAAVLGGTGLAYEATKAAQVAVSRHIAVRYAKRGIRSNALMLGLIDSTMVRREYGGRDELMEKRAAAPPMKRQGAPEEVAAAAAFLASDDASYVNGTVLVVDGGLASV
jgi:3-oxoacyl-[acyl-carrier protein] reductase